MIINICQLIKREDQTCMRISVLRPSRIFNSHFHWEVTKKLEVATELGFLNNDLMFAVNFYRNKSDNQLVNYPLPYITGFTKLLS